jgi:hypothetical protein
MASKETVPKPHSPQPQLRPPQEILYCADPNCEHCEALKKALQEMQSKSR